jgi:hypothetical protein
MVLLLDDFCNLFCFFPSAHHEDVQETPPFGPPILDDPPDNQTLPEEKKQVENSKQGKCHATDHKESQDKHGETDHEDADQDDLKDGVKLLEKGLSPERIVKLKKEKEDGPKGKNNEKQF